MVDHESDFIPVRTRSNRSKLNVKSKTFNPSLTEVINIVTSKLEIYNNAIIGAFIYGSRARCTNRYNSDADIIIFWKYEYDHEFLKSVRTSIEEELGFKIDFVACVFKKKWVEHSNQCDQAYFENVIIDAKSIMGIESIKYLIEHSKKLPKLSR